MSWLSVSQAVSANEIESSYCKIIPREPALLRCQFRSLCHGLTGVDTVYELQSRSAAANLNSTSRDRGIARYFVEGLPDLGILTSHRIQGPKISRQESAYNTPTKHKFIGAEVLTCMVRRGKHALLHQATDV